MFSVDLFSLYFLPLLLLSSAPLTGAQTVITASSGKTVLLPCSSSFHYSDRVNVKWHKDGGPAFCQYYIQNNKTTNHNCQPQYKINEEPFGLIITDVGISNAGVYNCSMTKVLPPPIEDNSSTLRLQVNADIIIKQTNSSNVSCVDLLCSLEGLSSEQVNFSWTRGSEQLLYQNVPTSMSSMLQLCKPNWTYGDTITCHASYSSNHTSYSKDLTLTCNPNECKTSETPWLLIGSIIGASMGLLLLILLSVALCKCRKKEDPRDSVVFSNKVYENLNFFTSRPSTGPGSTMNPRPNPQGQCQTQREECIYEN